MKRNEKGLTLALAVGTLLLAAAFTLPIDLSTPLTIYGIISFLLFSTYGLKLFTKASTFHLGSMVKTEKFRGFIEWISKFNAWDLLADIGLVIGFGVIAVDYLVARHRRKGMRIAINVISFVVLFTAFFFIFWAFTGLRQSAIVLMGIFALAFALGGFMLFAIVALMWQAWDIFSKMFDGKTPCAGAAPIIPGVQLPNVPFVPPLYVWVVFLVMLAIHEFSHGALIRRAGGKIKSVGLLLAGLLPIGAFVEPDEEELKTKTERQQLRVFAIGPASNLYSIPVFLVLFIIVGMAISFTAGPAFNEMQKNAEIESVKIAEVMDSYELCGDRYESAAFGQIEEGWEVLEYNGVKLGSLYDLAHASLPVDNNVSLILRTDTGEIVRRDLVSNEETILGFKINSESITYVEGKAPGQEYTLLAMAIKTIEGFFAWLILLSLAIAMVNFLPLAVFDGARIAKIMLVPYFGFMKMDKVETEKLIGRLFLWIIGILLFLNALPLFL